MNFAARSTFSQAPNALSVAVAARRASGRSFVDLTGSNPTAVGLGPSRPQLSSAFNEFSNSQYVPQPFGLATAREAIARWHRGAVHPDNVVLAASTSEAYSWLFKLLCNPGEQVLVPQPGYPLLDFLTTLDGVQARPYATHYAAGRWQLDIDNLKAATSARTKAVVIIAPGNPTGAILTEAELEIVAQWCSSRRLALIVDEVFADTIGVVAPVTAACVRSALGLRQCLTFVLRGLSKTVLTPQLKLAWIACCGPPPLVRPALDRLELIADTYLSVAMPVQSALPRLLAMAPIVLTGLHQRLRQNWATVQRSTANSAIGVLHSDGGWSAVLRFPATLTDEALAMAALQFADVLVQPGYFYDFADASHIVVSLITPPDDFARGIAQLTTYICGACELS